MVADVITIILLVIISAGGVVAIGGLLWVSYERAGVEGIFWMLVAAWGAGWSLYFLALSVS